MHAHALLYYQTLDPIMCMHAHAPAPSGVCVGNDLPVHLYTCINWSFSPFLSHTHAHAHAHAHATSLPLTRCHLVSLPLTLSLGRASASSRIIGRELHRLAISMGVSPNSSAMSTRAPLSRSSAATSLKPVSGSGLRAQGSELRSAATSLKPGCVYQREGGKEGERERRQCVSIHAYTHAYSQC